MPPSPQASTSAAEVSQTSKSALTKSEPEVKSEMYHDLDCELFQSLQWCGTPAEQGVAQSIDYTKTTDTRALPTDTLHTQFSPQGWDVSDAASPSAQANFNYPTSYPVSPSIESATFSMDNFNNEYVTNSGNIPFPEQFLDISTLPVLIDDFASESNIDTNSWLSTEPVWHYTNDIEYNKPLTDTNTLTFIEQEDSLDMKLGSVTPRAVESNEVMITDYIINGINSDGVKKIDDEKDRRNGVGLSVNILNQSQPWGGDIISTPEVLSVVEQLEEEKCPLLPKIVSAKEDECIEETIIENSPHIDYEPITPKTEPHIDSDNDDKLDKRKRRHHDSEDSDETYTPYTEHTPRKYRKRKPSLPIKDMIRELEGSQQLPKARRGRPPKRRESTISTVSENSSMSTHDFKYRELRDKNNEASKRSRMNRKLKELQMEQLVEELEERNRKLRVRAQLLEDKTKELREAFMTVVTQKKN